ncbi:MAG TPA: serine hydrolase [Pyrinomonadaceae bacterium]|jgi:beta-lactamase class A|nr:serine hydrolase [Pyrinomonadaceae bacterium]
MKRALFLLSFISVLSFIPAVAAAQNKPAPAAAAAAAAAAPTPQSPQSPQSPLALDARVQSVIAGFKGKVWIYAKNLDTSRDYALRADEPVRTASTIKLPIMATVFQHVAQGKVKWDDEIILTKEKKKGGSGILFEFSDNTKLDLRSALHLMIVVSDNSATNLVLDKVSADSVNEFMATLGLKQTLSLRKVFGGGESKAFADPANIPFGLGKSSPRDMVRLLEMLERGEIVSKEASAEMIGILKRQQLKDGLWRGVPDNISTASKSGALDALRSDVGIIYSPNGRIAMAITVDNMPVIAYNQENAGLALIWKLSQVLQDQLGRPDTDLR